MGVIDSLSMPECLAFVGISLALYTIGLVVYRLYFSPIASFPGPLLARTTFWYEFYHDWVRTGQYWMEIENMHRKYGPVVRITPTEIHVRDPAFYNELFVTGAVRKTEAYPRFAEGTGFEDIFAVSTPHDMHRATRSPLSPFFSVAGISRAEERAVQRVEQLCSRLNGFINTGKPVNMTHAFGSLMNDIISSMFFEEPSEFLNDPTFNAEWFELLKKGAVTIPLLAHMPWFAKVLVMPVVKALFERVTECRVWDDKARRQMLKSRLRPADDAKNRNDTTIFDHLVHSDVVESIYGNGGFARVSQLLQQAGTHNTSTTLGTMVTYLGLNPDVEEQLREELRTLYAENSEKHPSWRQLEKLPYLKACYLEALRLAMGLLHRHVRISPDVELESNGWKIPRGTAVSMTIYWIHMDPDIYPDPTKFELKRWLGDQKSVEDLQDYFFPFAKGSRACVAKNLVDMVVYHTIAKLYGPLAPRLKLYNTQEDAVRAVHGLIFPLPRLDSPGVLATITNEL